MAADDRTKTTAVDWLEQLAAEPFRFGFYQSLRRMENIWRDKPRIGHASRPRDEPLRLGQEPSMTFASSSLATFEKLPQVDAWRLRTCFFGLLGPNGPLPLHLTEHAYERWHRHRDPTFAGFLDVFHHRLATLFYRAWADSQPTVQYDRPESDRFSVYVGSLIGIGADSLRDRDPLPDDAKLHFAGHLSCQTRHAEGLRAILASFLEMPAALEQFVGHWLDLPDNCRAQLGHDRASATLGVSAMLGRRVWDRAQSFRLQLGPMSYADYCRLLPGGESLKRVEAIVKNYVGLTLAWDVRLVLCRQEIPRWRLGQEGRLGFTSWLTPRQPTRDAADLTLRRGQGGLAAAP